MKKLILAALIAGTFAGATMAKSLSFKDFDKRARAGEKLTVAFFGASLTRGANATDQSTTSYRAVMARHFQAKYPKAHFTFIDGAIGGTGSDLGVFRLQRDCLAHTPDLVFLDFSANDDIYNGDTPKLERYESLVRRILTEGKCPVVVMIFPFEWNAKPGTADEMAGRLNHIGIAKGYNLPVGDAIVLVQEKVAKDEGEVRKIWDLDGVHPGDYGYQVFAEAGWMAFEKAVKDKMTCIVPTEMMYAPSYMTWSRNELTKIPNRPAGWYEAMPSRVAAWHDGLMSRWLSNVLVTSTKVTKVNEEGKKVKVDNPECNTPLVVKFKGTSVLVFGEETVKGGTYVAKIDGEVVEDSWSKAKEFSTSSAKMGGGRQYYKTHATGLDPEQVHTLEIIPQLDMEKDEELRLESICIAGGEAKLVE